MTLFHGSQGCNTYMRLYLAHLFREPQISVLPPSGKRARSMGGHEPEEGIEEHHLRVYPSIVGVSTTSLAETIGEDVPRLLTRVSMTKMTRTELIAPQISRHHITTNSPIV
jgi:nitrogenase molybdenum-iron protein NifN